MDPRSPPPGWPDRAIGELAADQAGNVTRRQLLALGVSPGAIGRALARGRLHRVHAGVYSPLHRRARPPLAAEWAAVLAVGPGAHVSHASAAALHGLTPPRRATEPVTVTVVAGHRHRRAGVRAHRVAVLHPADRTRLRGLPITSVARTVLDLAPDLRDPELAAVIDRAYRSTSRTRLREAADRRSGRPGAARVLALLDPARPSADVWSVAERRLLELVRRAGLPPPEANVPVAGYVPDLLWREPRVIVEFDSRAHHSSERAILHDTPRHNDLTALHGHEVIHVTWHDLANRPERVLVWVAVAISRTR